MPRSHKVIDVGPSASGRWSVCTASPKFIVEQAEHLPEDKSVFADEGSVAHLLASKLLTNEDTGPVGEEMMKHVRTYVDHVSQRKGNGTLLVEQPVGLFYLPHRNGIVDAAVLEPNKVQIFDLKYGQGVSVEAEGNTQMAIYAESLIQSWEQITEFAPDLQVEMTIVQPRDRNNPEAVRTWSLSRQELAALTGDLKAKAEIALAGKGEFVPDDKACQFCAAKGLCAAYEIGRAHV